MPGNGGVTCAKCGKTSKDNPSLKFHRFPLPSMHGPLRAKVWAKFCFPANEWTSNESLVQLYKQHKMLCGNHFDDSSFTSNDRSRLNKFAIPTGAQDILTELRDEQFNQPGKEINQPRENFNTLGAKDPLARVPAPRARPSPSETIAENWTMNVLIRQEKSLIRREKSLISQEKSLIRREKSLIRREKILLRREKSFISREKHMTLKLKTPKHGTNI